jgi:hypothetical protein
VILASAKNEILSQPCRVDLLRKKKALELVAGAGRERTK